jgi:hypothetical protein
MEIVTFRSSTPAGATMSLNTQNDGKYSWEDASAIVSLLSGMT